MASRRSRSLVCDGALDMLYQLTRRLRSRHDDRYHGGAVDHGLDMSSTWARVAQTTMAKRQRSWSADKIAGARQV
jgi:hypothetical protein